MAGDKYETISQDNAQALETFDDLPISGPRHVHKRGAEIFPLSRTMRVRARRSNASEYYRSHQQKDWQLLRNSFHFLESISLNSP